MARVALDPAIWQRIRIRAVEQGTTASDLANKALRAYLDGSAVVKTPQEAAKQFEAWLKRDAEAASATLIRLGWKPPVPDNGVGAPRSAPPPDLRIEGVIEESHQEGGTRVIDKVRLTGAAITEDPWKDLIEQPKIVKTPQEAATVAASLPSFNPAPKPTSKPRSKSRSGSKTSGTGA